jgi:hypothetical protein
MLAPDARRSLAGPNLATMRANRQRALPFVPPGENPFLSQLSNSQSALDAPLMRGIQRNDLGILAICVTSAAAADDQLSIQLVVPMLLFALPRRQDLILGNIRLPWLPMTDRCEPGRVRRQPALL